MNIPFFDLKAINAAYRDELIQAATRVIDSGWYIQGQEVQAFEQEFAAYCGTKHCIGVGNGLDALILTLRAWKELGKLKEGDEVIVPANTYIATILAITENRLTPGPGRTGSRHLQPFPLPDAGSHHSKNQGDHACSPLWPFGGDA